MGNCIAKSNKKAKKKYLEKENDCGNENIIENNKNSTAIEGKSDKEKIISSQNIIQNNNLETRDIQGEKKIIKKEFEKSIEFYEGSKNDKIEREEKKTRYIEGLNGLKIQVDQESFENVK